MKFKLKKKVGTHIERDKTYKPGDVVESEHNLMEMFSGKFEKVFEESPRVEAEIPMSDE